MVTDFQSKASVALPCGIARAKSNNSSLQLQQPERKENILTITKSDENEILFPC